MNIAAKVAEQFSEKSVLCTRKVLLLVKTAVARMLTGSGTPSLELVVSRLMSVKAQLAKASLRHQVAADHAVLIPAVLATRSWGR
jgi:hypothetical protein